jgi:hypothetical protein
MASANHRDFVVQNRWEIKAGPPILYRGFRLRQEACCPNHFEDGGARLSQPQHVRQPQKPWNFVRSFGNPGCCGWDTRAPFHLGNTPQGYGGQVTTQQADVRVG